MRLNKKNREKLVKYVKSMLEEKVVETNIKKYKGEKYITSTYFREGKSLDYARYLMINDKLNIINDPDDACELEELSESEENGNDIIDRLYILIMECYDSLEDQRYKQMVDYFNKIKKV